MRIAFHLAHPAHFHLFNKTILNLIESGHIIILTYNEKDVLRSLIMDSKLKSYSYRISTIRNIDNAILLKIQFIQKIIGVFFRYFIFRPQIVLGTSVIISIIGRFLKYKSIIVNEDDFDIVQKTVDLGYPFATHILCPTVCRVGNFKNKSIKYEGYHELAYLHPNHFTPDINLVKSYFPAEGPFFLIRFAKLSAHHDAGIRGITDKLAARIIEILEPEGRVLITSERSLDARFEKYTISIDPLDIHHVMAFASIYIGDSQTMAAEAGVLGTPFIRFNDFVGRIGYLEELEEKYELGFGIKPDDEEKLFSTIRTLLDTPDLGGEWQKRRQRMLEDKIDVAGFMTWLIGGYPESVKILKEDPGYQERFK